MIDNVSKIKDRLDIVEVVGSYMKLQKAGINYKGRCPFHNEKTPSFFVTPERQIWHCFGCAKGGDMFEFVKEIEGVEFPEALKILAARAGVELEQYRPAPGETIDAKAKLYEVCELSTKFFEKQFQSPTGKKAYQYLLDRGLTPETISQFRLGFAPNDWESLSLYLQKCSYREAEIVDAGMAIKRSAERGREGIYDRFRSRIMFPIFDVSGQVVGFTGRVFESSESAVNKALDQSGPVMAKYVNSPGTLIYDKSRVLYGLSQAKLEIKRADQCVLVEGNIDALMSYQAGVRNVVASSGTALTPYHLRLLQRYTKNLGFCFDTDQAGSVATKRGIGLALAQQFNIKVLEINDRECKDPADFVKKYGPIWSDVVASAKPVIDYYFDKARATYNPTSAESKKSALAIVAPFIKRLGSNIERSHWTGQLAALLRVPESAVVADIAQSKDDLDSYAREDSETAPVATVTETAGDRPDMLNEAVLSIVLKYPAIVASYQPFPYNLLDPETAAIIQKMNEHQGPFDFNTFVAGFSGAEAMQLEFAHLRAQELWNNFTQEDLAGEFQSLINALRRRVASARLASLQFDLKEAETHADSERIIALASEFTALAQELNTLNQYHGNQKETQKAG